MAGWFATEMPRWSVRPCGLIPWEENTTKEAKYETLPITAGVFEFVRISEVL